MSITADVRVDLDDFQLEVAIEVPTGHTLAVVGPNGSGKSTFVSVLAGHVAADGGSVSLSGIVVDRPADGVWIEPERRPVALVPQDGLLFPFLDVAANMRFGLRYRQVPDADIDALVAQALAAVELTEVLHRDPAELSGGQAQRVALARALALHQPILLLDEPLSRVDVSNRRLLRRAIDELRPPNQTQVIVTHGHDHASEADLVLALDHGKTVAVDTPANLAEDPPTDWLAELFN